MKRDLLRLPGLLLACAGLAGCHGLGQSDTLFFTVSNYGLNLDTKPPTVELAFSRREGVIQPEFEGGQHLPVAAAFTGVTGVAGGADVKIGTTSIIAGGAAAHILADTSLKPADALAVEHGRICVTQAPIVTDAAGRRQELPGASAVRPFVFGTDSSIGLKVGWSGLTAAMPDSLQFGYARKELALASAFVAPAGCTERVAGYHAPPAGAANYPAVGMPSFLATINSQGTTGNLLEVGFRVGQTFATGTAARIFAADDDVRKAFKGALVAAANASAAVSNAAAGAATSAAPKAAGP